MELQKFFEPGKLPKIVVLGDLMLDRYIFGSVSRISPEAPVPVLKHGSCKEVIGGSGNVAANIVAMGATVSLISLTGDDQNRDVVLNLCHEFDVQTANLVKSTTRQTTIKTRYLSGNQQILRLDDEDASIMTEAEHSAVIHNLSEALENADCLVLSDYDKGMFKGDIAPQAIKLATAMNIPVIVDPKGHDYKKYHGATLITPNLKELQEAVSRTVYTDKEVVEACRELIAKFDATSAVSVAFLIPIFGVLWGINYLGEQINITMIAAMLVILIGLVMSTFPTKGKITTQSKKPPTA